MATVGQQASREWAMAALAWGDAAALWEAAVKKTPVPVLSEVRARWASAARSWGFAARSWAPHSDGSWPPGNLAWTSGSFYWAAVAHGWARASVKWAAAAATYPRCARESLGFAASAIDWASAAEAWAKPQSTWEAPLFEWPSVGTLFAVAAEHAAYLAVWARAGPVSPHPHFPAKSSVAESGKTTHEVVDSAPENHAAWESAADVAAWACAGSGIPPLHNHGGLFSEMCQAMGNTWTENAGYGRGEGVEAPPVAKAPPHSPSAAETSVAVPESGKRVDSAPENHAPREETASSVPVTEPSEKHADQEGTASSVPVTEPSEKHAPREETASSVPVIEPSEKHAPREDTSYSGASGKPSVTVTQKVANPKEQAAGTSVKPLLPKKVKSSAVAVGCAAAETTVRKEEAGNPPDINNYQTFPVMPQTDPKQKTTPKPGRQRQRHA